MLHRVVSIALCVFVGLSAGCVEKERHTSKASRELQKTIVLSAAPKPQHALDIEFGDKVRLLGYDIEDSNVREGKPFTVTWYWHVQKPLDAGYQVFTHVMDAKKRSRLNLDSARVLRQAYPESQWKAGEYLRDTQEVTVPDGWASPTATFCLGFWKDSTRLPVKGPSDGEQRALALTVEVSADGSEASAAPLPRIIAHRTSEPVKLDGKFDEPAWAAAQPSSAFVNTMTGSKAAFHAQVRVLYDAEYLYVGFNVDDTFLKSTFDKDDDHLWEQDVVEVMLDPDGDGKNYFELQVAPTGKVFDTRYDSRRSPRPFGDMAWSSKLKAGVALRGKVNDDEDDEGYDVELALPWSALAAGGGNGAPPKASETWRMNFFVLDARKTGQRAAGWSPPLVGDFHTLDRFGRVVFTQDAVPGASAEHAPAASDKL